MSWPSPTDYNEAVQNPRLGFNDPELKRGQPELTPLGTPRPYSGAFATVYKLQCGARTWAVRCFNREYHDQQERYEAIGAHLAKARLPYTVGFEYLKRGILVRGRWYPVVKMEWIRGETLSSYVAQNLGRVEALLDLADQWQRMLADLQNASVAHGDLSHGNILVVDGQLRLVDYDGMFVPALAGRETHEIGHRNYQHPLRSQHHFGPDLDHFSAWVIYVSLLALSAEPALWQQFHGGDECLLLRRADFEEPASSPVLAALSLSPDPRTRGAALQFQSLLGLPPEALPPLGLVPRVAPGTACAGCGRPLGARLIRCPKCGLEIAGGRPPGVPEWLADHLPKRSPAALEPETEPTEAPGGAGDISWIFERLATNTAPSSFGASVNLEHNLLWVVILLSVAGLAAVGMQMLPTVAFLEALALLYPLLIGGLAVRYRRDPAVRERFAGFRSLAPVERRLRKLDRRNRANLASMLKMRNREKELSTEQQNSTVEIDAREDRGLAAVKAEFQRRLVENADARRRLQIDETAVMQRLEAEFARKISDLTAEINRLPQDEEARKGEALRILRMNALLSHLRKFRVSAASIPGVGPSTIGSLVNAGILTAADVLYWQVNSVRGISAQKVSAVLQWRHGLEASAILPGNLPPGALQAIHKETEAKGIALLDARQKKQNQLANERAIVRNSYAKSREDLDRADRAAQGKAQAGTALVTSAERRQRQRLQGRFEPQFRKIAASLAQMQAEAGEFRRQTCELAWKRSQLLHRAGAAHNLTFRAYLIRVLEGE